MAEGVGVPKSRRKISLWLKVVLSFLFLLFYSYFLLKLWEFYFSPRYCPSYCSRLHSSSKQEESTSTSPPYYEGSKSSKQLPPGLKDVLLLGGKVTRDGQVTLDEDWAVVRNGVVDIYRFPPRGDYLLQFLDRNGQALFEYPFDVSFKVLANPVREIDTSGFTFGAPYYPETKRVVIKHRGSEVASRTVSEHKPTIRVISPNGGERFTDSFTIRWEASDADGGTLYYDVSISPDGGQTWTGYSPMQIEGTTAFFDLTRYIGPRGSNCLIKVQVTDGFNTAEDISDKPFAIAE